MNVPERVVGQEPVRRGSVILGFGLAWLTVIATYGLFLALSGFGGGHASPASSISAPWVVAILLIIWLVATKRTRTALGVAIGLVTVLVVCVGLFLVLAQMISNNFR